MLSSRKHTVHYTPTINTLRATNKHNLLNQIQFGIGGFYCVASAKKKKKFLLHLLFVLIRNRIASRLNQRLTENFQQSLVSL